MAPRNVASLTVGVTSRNHPEALRSLAKTTMSNGFSSLLGLIN